MFFVTLAKIHTLLEVDIFAAEIAAYLAHLVAAKQLNVVGPVAIIAVGVLDL